jgi:phosphatidylglycerol:prolipoprotein diacylglycerol transferase
MPFVIDVDPVAFSLFGLHVRWYGLLVAAGGVVAVWAASREAGRRGLAAGVVSDATVWVALAALLGGRVLYLAQTDAAALVTDPLRLIALWDGGLSFYGALGGAVLALLAFSQWRRLRPLTLLDVAAPAAAIGQAIGHLGCLIGGDSYGIPTDLPWAVVYANPAAMAPLGVPLHPTQAYEAILLGGLSGVLWLVRERLAAIGPGAMAGAYLFGLAAIRFGLFFLRDEPSVLFGLKTAQLIGIGVSAMALLLVVLAWRGRPAPSMHRSMEVLPS